MEEKDQSRKDYLLALLERAKRKQEDKFILSTPLCGTQAKERLIVSSFLRHSLFISINRLMEEGELTT